MYYFTTVFIVMVRIVGKNFVFYHPPRCRSEECDEKIDRESIIRKRKARNASENSVIKTRKLWSDDTESEISTTREIDEELNSSVFQSDDEFKEDSDYPVVEKDIKTNKRKERRREKNKFSARAYRRRCQSRTQEQTKVIEDLKLRKIDLLTTIENLEEEKSIVLRFLRSGPHATDVIAQTTDASAQTTTSHWMQGSSDQHDTDREAQTTASAVNDVT